MASWSDLGKVLEASWRRLGGVLGLLGGVLGRLGGVYGVSWGVFGGPGGILGRLETFQDALA